MVNFSISGGPFHYLRGQTHGIVELENKSLDGSPLERIVSACPGDAGVYGDSSNPGDGYQVGYT